MMARDGAIACLVDNPSASGYNRIVGKHRFLNDMVFKVVFASATNDHLLRALLNALLGLTGTERITEIHILNPYVDKTYLTEKGVVLDIKARDGQGQRYNIEVQLQDQSAYP